jgi:2,4-dienoyl-CoA reductase-like NADH-dependent reductase (Old Yellow Enzyme family)
MTTTIHSSLSLTHGPALSNRLAKSAMSERLAAAGGRVSEELVRLYARWGKSGAGLLVTGNVMVDARALGESGNVVVEDETDLDALRAWASAAKAGGARVWMQINHPGRQSPRTLSKAPVAPSAIRLKGAGPMFATPRALTNDEIEQIVQRFATTARIAEKAGFDGVQIHGAHGYLVSQFLSPYTNQRDDAWGGDATRRRRFLLEIVSAIRSSVSDDFSVGLKLNSADFQKGGFGEAESMAVLEDLDGRGLDVIEVSGGTYESAKMFEETVPTRASSQRREAFFLEYVEKARARIRTPLMLTGGLRTRGGLESALASGVDVVGLARPMAVEPDLPAAFLAGTVEHAVPIKLSTGIASLDAVIQGSWYQIQIDRMGRGLEPDLRASRIRAVLTYLGTRRGTPFRAAVSTSVKARAAASAQAT